MSVAFRFGVICGHEVSGVVAFLICMQVVRSAQLMYRFSLLTESFSVLVEGTQSLSSESQDVPPAASSGSTAVASL